jgi:endogenous inhibitor of DNA gyrase (YacG/DUF329 family)
VSLLLKDRLVDVVIIIHFVVGLVMALDGAGMSSVEATSGLAVDCGGCQGSKLVIASSRFFAFCSWIYQSVSRIKSWISGVIGIRVSIFTFSLGFDCGELTANLTCCWRWHLVSSDIWQDSLTCGSTVVWALASLALARMLLSVLIGPFALLA